MLDRLAGLVVRRRWPVLLTALGALVVAGAFGGNVADRLTGGGFDDPASASYRADQFLEEHFGVVEPNVVLLVDAPAGTTVDDPALAAAGAALTGELAAEPDIGPAFSYWTLGSTPALRSEDGTQALVLAAIPGDDDHVSDVIEELSPRYSRPGDAGAPTVRVGGMAEVYRQVADQIERDLQRAELITLPITMILLVLIFGSVVAASLPLAVGVFAVIGTFFVLRVLSSFTDVSVYALNLTTALGLGLAIDYSLFIVSRYREELARGLTTADAIRRTLATAGRTVIFSAMTVAISLAALLVFPLVFLRSFAYAGIVVVALAGAASVVVLPALLAALGPRVNRLRIGRPRATPAQLEARGTGFWHRVASAVMRRPVISAVAVLAVLGILGAPFLGIRLGLGDDRVLPESASSHQVQDDIRTHFGSNEANALQVVARDLGPAAAATPAERDAAIAAYARELSTIPGVARVDALTGSYAAGQALPADVGAEAATARFVDPAGGAATWWSVVPSVEPLSEDGEQLAHDVRDAAAPFETLVAGPSAALVDTKASLFSRMPLALGIIALVTFVVMFLMVGSVLVPVKALVLNLFSLSATFGAMVFIFQSGHLSGLLDFTATGSITATMPILMFCIAFGLSMDYEVFLLSRIKEEYDRTGDNEHSVALGLERTGRIVTAAAALLSFVFLAFATSGISFIKMFGLGLALAVVMDATLVRGVLVPAFMRLAGRANWWAPGPMRRLYERVGWSERDTLPTPSGTGPHDGARAADDGERELTPAGR
jgi:RND superfamily putative drug exporter